MSTDPRPAIANLPAAPKSPDSVDPYEVFRRPTREVDMTEIRKRMMDTLPPPRPCPCPFGVLLGDCPVHGHLVG